MRVMVFTPCYRLEQETVDAIFRMQPVGPMEILFTRDQPHGESKADVLHNYQVGRQRFLASDCDAMLVVESDVIPPTDALVKLVLADADVALGLYILRGRVLRYNVTRGLPLDLDTYREYQGQVVECNGAGLGCALIRRPVLEQFEFRAGDGKSHCDEYFTNDVKKSEFSYVAHLGVECGHKQPDNLILWPDPDTAFRATKGEPSKWHMNEAVVNPNK